VELTGTVIVRLPEELSTASVSALTQDLRAAFDSPADVVLVAGADEAAFCTGLALGDATGNDVDTRAFAAVLASVLDAPKPTLAFVEGRAIGGGLGLAAACDWIVASDRATFGLPELVWGLIPAMIWPIVTTRLTEGTARRWVVSAHTRSAAEALAAGLVDEVAPADRCHPALRRAVRMLRRSEPNALRRFRRWGRESRLQPINAALTTAAAITEQMAAHPDVRVRVNAFHRGETPWD
jgi:enoyl-CoA hydratase/carnithine racemase